MQFFFLIKEDIAEHTFSSIASGGDERMALLHPDGKNITVAPSVQEKNKLNRNIFLFIVRSRNWLQNKIVI